MHSFSRFYQVPICCFIVVTLCLFYYCFITRVSTRVPTCSLPTDAKQTNYVSHAQVQYTRMPRWCMWTAKPHLLATLRITKGVSDVVHVSDVNITIRKFNATAAPKIAGILNFRTSSLWCWGICPSRDRR